MQTQHPAPSRPAHLWEEREHLSRPPLCCSHTVVCLHSFGLNQLWEGEGEEKDRTLHHWCKCCMQRMRVLSVCARACVCVCVCACVLGVSVTCTVYIVACGGVNIWATHLRWFEPCNTCPFNTTNLQKQFVHDSPNEDDLQT